MAPSTVIDASEGGRYPPEPEEHVNDGSNNGDNNVESGGTRQPITATDVDNPSHPLHRLRRTVTDFEYGPILGEGSYSTVLMARDKTTGKQYAIKKLDKAHIVKNDKVKYVMIERDALSKMNHPGIVRLYWTFKDNRSLYYVLDLARNGELYTYIRRLAPFDLSTARFYAAEILLAIEHIHSQNVIHRDIKPENILLDDRMHVKITDFGSAKILQPDGADEGQAADSSKSRSFVGTAEYVSPELLRSEPTSRESDLWAFACVIFQMLSGRSPFKAATDYLIFQKVKNLEYAFPEEFPEVAKDLVQRILVSEPQERLGSSSRGGIDAIKQHPFFEGVDWDHIWEQQAPPIKEQLDEKLGRQRPNCRDNDIFDDLRDDNESEFDAWFRDEEGNPFSDEAACHDEEGDSIIPPVAASEPLSMIPAEPEAAVHPSHISSQEMMRRTSTSSTLERLGEQSHPPWMPHLYPNESIIKAGRMVRRRGLFSKKRYLILTDRPRLLYLDEGRELNGAGGNLRCEIAWTPELLPELKTKSVFVIHTPQKDYTFEDPEGHAQDWVNIINSMLVDSFGVAA